MNISDAIQQVLAGEAVEGTQNLLPSVTADQIREESIKSDLTPLLSAPKKRGRPPGVKKEQINSHPSPFMGGGTKKNNTKASSAETLDSLHRVSVSDTLSEGENPHSPMSASLLSEFLSDHHVVMMAAIDSRMETMLSDIVASLHGLVRSVEQTNYLIEPIARVETHVCNLTVKLTEELPDTLAYVRDSIEKRIADIPPVDMTDFTKAIMLFATDFRAVKDRLDGIGSSAQTSTPGSFDDLDPRHVRYVITNLPEVAIPLSAFCVAMSSNTNNTITSAMTTSIVIKFGALDANHRVSSKTQNFSKNND